MKNAMSPATVAALASSLAASSALAMQGAPASIAAPAQAPAAPAGQPAPAPQKDPPYYAVSAPTASSPDVALPPRTETACLSSPVPTVSPTWGYRTAVMGTRIFAAGPERAVAPGAIGQLCMWLRDGETWKANPNLMQLERATTGAYGLQRLVRGGDLIFTAMDRRDEGTTIRVLQPTGTTVAEVGSVMLPPGADLPTFGSSYASDGSTLVVGSADVRFNRGDAPREKDPKVFLFSRKGDVWGVDGFVKSPRPQPGAPADSMWFGVSVAIDGDVLAVGCPHSIPPRPTEKLPDSGYPHVVVFRRSAGQWMPEVDIEGPLFTNDYCFGIDVAVEGDLLAVRSINTENVAAPARVFLFKRAAGKWALKQELVPAKGISRTRAYGLSIAISKGHVLIGDASSRGADETGEIPAGAVLVFEEKGDRFENTLRLMPKQPSAPRSFGLDVSADWPIVAVGRPKNERLGIDPGGAYVFDLSK
jgi:hypothetical protein